MGEFVRVEVDQAVATIRLDRPTMNALNAQVQAEIAAAAAQVADDATIRAVIIYGGEKVFAAWRRHQGDGRGRLHPDGGGHPAAAGVVHRGREDP